MPDDRHHPPPWPGRTGLLCLLVLCLWPALAQPQERTGYLLGERQGLEMIVHIIGEVRRPGEYRVPDQTSLLELLSKAGGPTEYSRLSSVRVRRTMAVPSAADSQAGETAPRIEIYHVNLDKLLSDRSTPLPLLLRPGDVVLVPKNAWHKWRDISAIVRDVSVVTTAYFLYLRATR